MSDTTDSTPVTTTTTTTTTATTTTTTTTPEIYIHYVFSTVTEALIRQKIGSLLEGAPITNVIMMTRQNPTTGYDYQSARISVDWSECEKSDNDLGKIKKALEDGKQIKVDYDTRAGKEETKANPKATSPYWILVKHREIVIPKPGYELLSIDHKGQEDRVEMEDDKDEGEFPDLYIHYVFTRTNDTLITKTLSSLIPGVEFTIEKTWDRITKKGQEYKSVRINASYTSSEKETDKVGKEIHQGFTDGKILRVNYDTRKETTRYWLVSKNRRFQQTTPSFQIMPDKK